MLLQAIKVLTWPAWGLRDWSIELSDKGNEAAATMVWAVSVVFAIALYPLFMLRGFILLRQGKVQ